MKKSLALALVLALLLALAAPAFAFAIQRSAQNLSVDGRAVACDKYNIEGSNYFKLRDLAALLNGTGSQFDVGWDGDRQLVSITTNHPYTTPNGAELVIGEDKSATAVLSAQTIMVDGQVRRDLTVYNIGGSNFFQLREMGQALGFNVDYDQATNTAIVESRDPAGGSDLKVTDLCNLTGKIVTSAGYMEYYSFQLPKISGADTPYLRSVNAAVQEIYEQHVQTSLSNLAEYGALSTYCVCYKYAVNGDIHSLFIVADSDWGADFYWCFNFDSAGNEVKNADVLKAAGQTEAGFVAAAKAFLTDYTDLSEYVEDEEFWKPLQEQTIAADNLNAGIPMVLLPGGNLCCVATVYTPAGAGVYDKALEFTGGSTVASYNNFGMVMLNRFQGTYLVDGVAADGTSYLLDFFTIGDQATVEVTGFDAEAGGIFFYYAADITPLNETDMLRGDLDSIRVSLLSYCPDVAAGSSYYGDPGIYTVTFTDGGLIFSDFGGGVPVVDESFTAQRVYRDDLGLESEVPSTDYERFDFGAVDDAGITGIWYCSYRDLSGESHGLTLELTSWGQLRLRDVTDTGIPKVLDGSYYIAGEDDDSGAPAGSVVFQIVSRAGYKMPNFGFCTMTVGPDGKLRVTDAFDSYSQLTDAGIGVTVTLKPVPPVRNTVYAEP